MDSGYIYVLLVVSACVVTCLGVPSGLGFCTGTSQCQCQFDNGQYLQLDDLANEDGTPRFVNITDTHEMSYSWNPCYNFTEGDCKNVAMCGIQPSLPHDLYMPLGDQNLVTFTTNTSDRTVTLVYKTNSKPLRTSYVKLVCINETQNYLKAFGQKQQLSTDFYFELRSKAACPQGVPNTPTTSKPPNNNSNSVYKTSLIVVSIIACGLMVALLLVVLKMKGKICAPKEVYDTL